MSRFLEITDTDTNESILVDKELILSIRQRKDYTDVLFGYSGETVEFSVKEDYEKIKKQLVKLK